MKKIIKKYLQVAVVIISALILFCNVSINGNNKVQNIDLNSLIKMNSAEAECEPLDTPGSLPGICNVFDRCVWNPEPEKYPYDCGM
ncbi:MAG: hypothetical protein WCY58_13530 [Mariniphaga sp.]